MSPQEQSKFDQELASNPNLKAKVESQRSITEAIQLAGIKLQAKASYQTYKIRTLLTKLIILISAIVAAAGISLFVMPNENSERFDSESGPVKLDTLAALSNQFLEESTFQIHTGKDTVIENQDGVVIFIPSNAFDTDLDHIELKVQSAIKPEDIMYAGLSTTSNGKALETGGMFYIDALADGERVNLLKDLTVNMPTNKKIEGMQLYRGEKTASSEVNWVNPEPILNELIPVDITALNFYPPEYEPYLNQLGHTEKQFLDSLYYSFAFEEENTISQPDKQEDLYYYSSQIREVDSTTVIDKQLMSVHKYSDDTTGASLDSTDDDVETISSYGINPASIKTIWSNDFNNTILATTSFEARIPWIHESCNQAVLDLYVNHLDKGLSEIDALVVPLVSGKVKEKFIAFSKQGDGKVNLSSNAAKKLGAFYNFKRKMHAKAIRKTQETFWAKQREQDLAHQSKIIQQQSRDAENSLGVLQKEYEKNLCKVYEDIDYPYDCKARPMPSSNYTVNVGSLGWHNIDRDVMTATLNRKTTSFSYKAKTSTLTYEKWIGTVINHQDFERVYVYNLPSEFNSYVKLNGIKGKYDYPLNADLNYQTLVLAWTSSDLYFVLKTTKPGKDQFNLKKISKSNFNKIVQKKINNHEDLKTEMSFLDEERMNSNRINQNLKRSRLRAAVKHVIFPCYGDQNSSNPVEIEIVPADQLQ